MVSAYGNQPLPESGKAQKKRAADSTTARLINYFLYSMPREWPVEQKMAGSLPAGLASPKLRKGKQAGLRLYAPAVKKTF